MPAPDKPRQSYDQLVALHGTLEEFSDAVWNAVGEISVDEARDAIEHYRIELLKAKSYEVASSKQGAEAVEPIPPQHSV